MNEHGWYEEELELVLNAPTSCTLLMRSDNANSRRTSQHALHTVDLH